MTRSDTYIIHEIPENDAFHDMRDELEGREVEIVIRSGNAYFTDVEFPPPYYFSNYTKFKHTKTGEILTKDEIRGQ